jgi:GNAT superfamily N-acetyltransferase
MELQRLEEFQLDEKKEAAIRGLFDHCFPDYPKGQIYYKQLPNFRYLAWEKDMLIGHMAVDHRVVNNGGVVLHVFGVSDLCVRPTHQHQRIASDMLQTLEQLARENHIDGILLVAADATLYENNGYQHISNNCRWVLINKHQTLGVVKRNLPDSLMVKLLNSKQWHEGELDFLGAVY